MATRRETSTCSSAPVTPTTVRLSGSSASWLRNCPGQNERNTRSPTIRSTSPALNRRFNPFATTSATSSTPAAAAVVSTASMTRPRTSGRRIRGNGVDRSSKLIVSRIPGRSNAASGSLPTGAANAAAIAASTSPAPGSDSGG